MVGKHKKGTTGYAVRSALLVNIFGTGLVYRIVITALVIFGVSFTALEVYSQLLIGSPVVMIIARASIVASITFGWFFWRSVPWTLAVILLTGYGISVLLNSGAGVIWPYVIVGSGPILLRLREHCRDHWPHIRSKMWKSSVEGGEASGPIPEDTNMRHLDND